MAAQPFHNLGRKMTINQNNMYDFEKAVDRRHSGCVKWDAQPPVEADMDNVIPMWVADMDFEVAPFIQEAILKRVQHGIFGYTCVPESFYKATTDWFRRRHGVTYERDWFIYTTGVVPAISAAVKALAKPGEKVILQSPVYNCFFSSIRNNGCTILDNPLKEIDTEDGLTYEIDFEDFERKCSDPAAKVFLLCNPHNPAGRVWTREELCRIGEIARKHGVIVVSDEIHCELVMPGYHYTPYAAASEDNLHNCVVFCSPSKSFNIAGLQIANIITENAQWRKMIDKAVNINEICDVNPIGVAALHAAYSDKGDLWLDELNAHIYKNYLMLRELFSKELPFVRVTRLEGTYLAWIDCRSLGIRSFEIEKSLLQNEKVWVNAGTMYGTEGFIRINLATTSALCKEGLGRIVAGLKRLKA